MKALAVISLTLEYSPEAFHRAVVDALCYSRHALCDSGFLKFCMKGSVGVLEPSVTIIPNSG